MYKYDSNGSVEYDPVNAYCVRRSTSDAVLDRLHITGKRSVSTGAFSAVQDDRRAG